MSRQIRIVDLDNTISQDDWRHWLIDPQAPDGEHKYHEYHLYCDGDTPMNRYIVDESPVDVFFLTARPEYVRQKTIDWLDNQGFRYKALIMRGNDDHQHSVELKRGVVRMLKLQMFEIEKAYDDRQDIIDMYREMGIKGVLV